MSTYASMVTIAAGSTSGNGVGAAFTTRSNMEGGNDANFATVTLSGTSPSETVSFTFDTALDFTPQGIGPDVSDVSGVFSFKGQTTGTLNGNLVFTTAGGVAATIAVTPSGVTTMSSTSSAGTPPGVTVQNIIDGFACSLRFTATSGSGDFRITLASFTLTIPAPTPYATPTQGAANRFAGPVRLTSPGDTTAAYIVLSGFTSLSMFQSDTTTEINDGDAISLAQAAAGVYILPDQNFVGLATYTAQGCSDSDPGNLVGDPVTFTVPILNSGRGRSYRTRQSVSSIGAANVAALPPNYS